MWEVPKQETGGYVNNQREKYQFGFDGIIGPEAKQDEVFERVASRSVLGSLEGFNGTVFAYGQTGSGKTFTISGGHDRYVDRGIIPRAISRLYGEISKRHDASYSVQITYVEIYNDQGYDLLDPDHETTALEDLPKVQLLEDDEGNVTMRNVSTHRADNEEEALNLLFLGDTNKAITETPMNQASSRSHCIFTMQVERRLQGSDTVRRAKVNLVDLAGSERVHKMGLDGQTLMEAKHINLSLHALEQVVVALQEGPGRSHIPYRNSMMTMMLKDSLGGNCRTVMIATASPRGDHLLEGISTCRFAQRIAMVTNEAVVNEEVDPALIIKRLKIENRELKDELRILRGDNDDGRETLTESEIDTLRSRVAGLLQVTNRERGADARARRVDAQDQGCD
jgi:kinesin family protein 6/9